ncbi:M56 family metallopeptidase [Cellulomonas sp. ATA003]|uniref:M56 family metallopeptidase n=1 Tax=Cellulomonas sp. ATA003 TaxID=3073064 RepID=UPI002873339B|nr:M56 family metallopeptidase [Cellulomonas sp. ATA003]WNB84759.1 M56 family metallopeptidase [Cellulomonas sp. ATA003]
MGEVLAGSEDRAGTLLHFLKGMPPEEVQRLRDALDAPAAQGDPGRDRPLALLVLAVLVGTLAPRLLRRSAWVDRSPAMGIVLWQALSLSVVAATVLAGAALALPDVPFTANLAELISACSAALRAQYATPAGAAASTTGAVFAVGVTARVGFCLTAGLVRAHRQRAAQLQALRLVADIHHRSGALVVEHDVAAAYCLPGRGRHIVLSTAALAQLDADELTAVLAHERAHLRHRHHLVLAASAALRSAFPRVPAFADADEELRRLVEMHADDVAARGSARLTIATALVRLAESSAPVAALGAGGDTSLARVRRLVSPAAPLGPARALVARLGALTLVVAPMVIAAAPAVAAATADLCPLMLPGPAG